MYSTIQCIVFLCVNVRVGVLPVNRRVVQRPAVLWGQVAVSRRSPHHSDLKQQPSILQGDKYTLVQLCPYRAHLKSCYPTLTPSGSAERVSVLLYGLRQNSPSLAIKDKFIHLNQCFNVKQFNIFTVVFQKQSKQNRIQYILPSLSPIS